MLLLMKCLRNNGVSAGGWEEHGNDLLPPDTVSSFYSEEQPASVRSINSGNIYTAHLTLSAHNK